MRWGRQVLDEVEGLRTLVGAQAGLARRDQLRALGVAAGHVAEQCRGRWRVVSPCVVSVDNGRLDAEQRLWAAVLELGTAWVGGRAALACHGLDGWWTPLGTLDVLVPRGARRATIPGVVVHVTSRGPAPPPALTLPLTDVARSTVDAAAWEQRPRAAAGLVLAVVQQRLATVEAIAAELDGAGRVRHRAVVRDALDAAARGAESVSENDVVALVRRAGLPAPRRQSRSRAGRHDLVIDLPDGRTLVVEVDGPQHETAEARWADARRDAELAVDGTLLLRIPTFAVTRDPDGVVAALTRFARPTRPDTEM